MTSLTPQCHYHIVRRDRDGRGGVVCILLLRSFDYIVYDSDLFSDLESLCVDVVICSERSRFLVIYRAPGHSSVALVSVFDCKHLIFVVGDVNCPGINWKNWFASNDGVQDTPFDLFIIVGCVQLVKEPTRLDNILYVVLTNTPIFIQSISNCESFGNSDHLSVKFAINLANSSNTVNSKSMHGEDSTYKLFRWKDANWPALQTF